MCLIARPGDMQSVAPEYVEVAVDPGTQQVLSSNLAWMGDYQSAESLFSHSVLPSKESQLCFARVFRCMQFHQCASIHAKLTTLCNTFAS